MGTMEVWSEVMAHTECSACTARPTSSVQQRCEPAQPGQQIDVTDIAAKIARVQAAPPEEQGKLLAFTMPIYLQRISRPLEGRAVAVAL